MKKGNFEKFIKKELKGAKKREVIKQEKRQYNKEKRAFFDEQKRLKRLASEGQPEPTTTRFDKSATNAQYKKVGKKSSEQSNRTKNVEQPEPTAPQNKSIQYTGSTTSPSQLEKKHLDNKKKSSTIHYKQFRTKSEKLSGAVTILSDKHPRENNPKKKKQSDRNNEAEKQLVESSSHSKQMNFKPTIPSKNVRPYAKIDKPAETRSKKINVETEKMPLNKFLSHAGICGRREAAGIIKSGMVTINQHKIEEPGYKVLPLDEIRYKGKLIFRQVKLVYILLNKPKDYITTVKDPEGRKTVSDLIKNATSERVFPVGRLDRNTTGVLLFTNDGELTQRLTHPSFQVRKIYEVTLNKPLTSEDFHKISSGISLNDGFIKPDALGYADPKNKSKIGIEIHSGKNRIVRRMFEHIGYDVKNLDRVLFANLTKKNIERGHWRFLTEKEIRLLKYLNKSFVKKVPH
jgi:23S rRNA pseudouridine2605 synthase